jgi:6-phosphogluconolactonase (cycloisomerase 2 family)
MFGGPGAGCCAFLTSPLAFTPDGTKAYATIELECPCHSSPSATWIIQSFQRDPASGAIFMDPIQPLDLPHSFNFVGNVAVLKNGKFVAFPTVDGLMVYAINSTDGSLTRVQSPSPVPPVDIDHTYEVVSATKDGEFVYLTQPNASRVFGFHVEDTGALTSVPGSPYNMLPADLLVSNSGQFVFVASPGSLMVFQRNLSTGELTPFGSAPVNTFVRAILNLH